MTETKACVSCKEIFPNDKQFFHKKKKDTLDSKCKKCRKETSFIHDCLCEMCGVGFKSDKKSRRFCSVACRANWQKNSEEYKDIMMTRDMTNMNKSVDVRESEYIEKFNDRYEGFEYVGGYNHIHTDIEIMRRACGNTIKRSAHVLHTPSDIECEHCKKKNTLTRLLTNLIDGIAKDKQKALTKTIDDEVAALKRIQRNHRYYCTCKECGKSGFSSRDKLYCSIKCCDRASSRVGKLRRDGRVLANGKVDWDISIDSIIKRDGNHCYICGEDCDKQDYATRSNGAFVAGNNYPSIEHVMPISKGGTHTWDNVLLAHRLCNSIKGTSERINNEEAYN